ncbi:hypothetical protein PX039_09875 [Acinetobacter baumannii]|uniref:hypothetical protein n=1 Tax=Acinetobacter baumannii TaxID=470 RepID=UPI000CDEB6DC|nr:hypothetical protein [Acinetobacter baumannii]HAV4232390.1 hypothetical protein [Acinetobacter baumannii ATCC 17978]EKU0940065.1 hypothetical protein [Acinetobacter baumannii]EKX7142165.1 hypothetical protein [Acinetobacter baumannii]MDA3480748.1 hypothetical protein [Acinetobacter baumannii]MDA3519549.1 hypothetical protein [Acinetobacter baumannii]
MATTFRSNQVATRFIKDVSGYAGPQDYYLSADFAQGIYKNSLGDIFDINSVIATNRPTVATVLNSPDFKDYAVVLANQLRLSYIPDFKTKGIISTAYNFTILARSDATTLTVSADFASSGTIFCLYTTEEGTVDLIGNNVVKLQGDGSFLNPLFFKATAATTLNIVRSGGALNVYCYFSAGGKAPFIPNFGQVNPELDALMINPARFTKSTGSLVMRWIEPTRKYLPSSAATPLLLLKQDENTYFALYRDTGNFLRARFYANGIELEVKQAKTVLDPNTPMTVGVSWSSGEIVLAYNTERMDFAQLKLPTNFVVNSIKVLGGLEQWLPQQTLCALLNLITYNRALTFDDLKTATYF